MFVALYEYHIKDFVEIERVSEIIFKEYIKKCTMSSKKTNKYSKQLNSFNKKLEVKINNIIVKVILKLLN